MRLVLMACVLLIGCAAARPPQPTLSPAKASAPQAATASSEPVAPPQPDALLSFREDSRFAQGGLAFGRTEPGARVVLDDIDVPVDAEGRFLLGFEQAHPAEATLAVTQPDGRAVEQVLTIAEVDFPFAGVIDVPASQVNQFTEAQLAEIRRSSAAKNAARAQPTGVDALWANGFDWPAKGYVTSRFGRFRRYPSGDVVSPHSGVDVAAPRAPGGGPAFDYTGAPVTAPADGVVTLAEPDMYFEGGLILIDHGQQLESALLHLSEVSVSAGDVVRRGQRIGSAGSTGRSTGPHVHWSVKWHGKLVDPQELVGPMEGSD